MYVDVGGCRIHCELEGPPGAPVVTFSHSLGATLGIWDAQVDALRERMRVLRYDTRGHGKSEAKREAYRLEQLAQDVIALLDALEIERTFFVGISLGGMIGQVLGLEHAGRLTGLALCDTTCVVPAEMRPAWDERIRVTEAQGMEAHVEATMERWFTPSFRASHPEVVGRIARMVRDTDPAGYVGCCHAIRELDLTDRIARIELPTLVLVGAEDSGTTPDVARMIHGFIEGSELAIIDSAAHLCNVEQPEAFNRALLSFL